MAHKHKRKRVYHNHLTQSKIKKDSITQDTTVPTTNSTSTRRQFSKTIAKFVSISAAHQKEYTWECDPHFPFNELILSWNAHRPDNGKLNFWVNVQHAQWSGWQKFAEWGAHTQKTFNNNHNTYVHTKHVRVVLCRGAYGKSFKIRVTGENGAQIYNLKALFACLADLKKFKAAYPRSKLPSILIKGVPKQSQMVLDHPRFKDLCSPTATSLILNYYRKHYGYHRTSDLHDYVCDFADKVHDRILNSYGSWGLNVAQAYDSSNGEVFFRVERLNSFNDLHKYLSQKTPVAVSVRHLHGGATPYANGHFMVVVGWNKDRQSVLCIDPAFKTSWQTLKAYKLGNFLRAWGRSVNLSYIPMPQKLNA